MYFHCNSDRVLVKNPAFGWTTQDKDTTAFLNGDVIKCMICGDYATFVSLRYPNKDESYCEKCMNEKSSTERD